MALSLKAMRVNLNKSAEEVADYVGVSKRTIYLWENDIESLKNARVKNLIRLCNLYSIKIDDVVNFF